MTNSQSRERTLWQSIGLGGFAIVAVHVTNASLFHLNAPVLERIAWAALSVTAALAVAVLYPALTPGARGMLALAVGLPAVLFGLAIHAAHAAQIGFQHSDYSGVPMLAAGLVLSASGTTTLVRSIHSWWRRLLVVPPALALVLFVVFPAGLGIFATNVARVACCAETPAARNLEYEDVTFETGGGVELSAWLIPSRNGAVVITVHGADNNRATVLDEAEVLARHGYGVLMLDLEGFGDSEGRANAFGWVGARDVHAAVEYLLRRPEVDPKRIGGLGLSMGGEVLLQAAGESPQLTAIVAEGSTGRTAADFGESGGRFDPQAAVHVVAGLTMRLISGESTPPPLKELVQSIAPRHVLLIAADIAEEQHLMGVYHTLGGATFDLWTIPESKHVGAFDLHPDEYEQRVIAFFDRTLRAESPALGSR